MCKDLTTGSYTSTESLKRYVLGDIMKPIEDRNLKWYAILPFTLNNVVKYTTDPYGYSIMKLRQLEKIGYTPVVVSYMSYVNFEWIHFLLCRYYILSSNN